MVVLCYSLKIKIMKKILVVFSLSIIFFSSCEVELRDGRSYHHYRGYEHSHYPNHHEIYNHGYHHDAHGGEILLQPLHN